jgi:hypothetical protein
MVDAWHQWSESQMCWLPDPPRDFSIPCAAGVGHLPCYCPGHGRVRDRGRARDHLRKSPIQKPVHQRRAKQRPIPPSRGQTPFSSPNPHHRLLLSCTTSDPCTLCLCRPVCLCLQRDLPPTISDPEAPYPFKVERRLDAGGAVNRTVALSTVRHHTHDPALSTMRRPPYERK